MRVMRAIHEHRGDTCDNALFFVLRAVSKNTALIPDLQDADPVCIRLQNLGGGGSYMTVDYRSLFVRAQREVPSHLTPTHTLGPPHIGSSGGYDTSFVVSGHRAAVTNGLVAGLGFRVLSALRGPFIDTRRTVSFASSDTTVPACLDLTRARPARWPARGFVRPA